MHQRSDLARFTTSFRLSVGLDQIVEHPGWRAVQGAVAAALGVASARIVLLGAPGTGKTLMLHNLARRYQRAGRSVRLLGRGELDETGADLALADLVLIDEADRLDDATLTRIGQGGGPAFVLAGMPALAERVTGWLAPIRVALAPLPPPHINGFLAERMAQTGQPANVLSNAALAALAEHSSGVPRLLNLLAGSALFLMVEDGHDRVSRLHVEQAASLRDGALSDAAPAPDAGAAPDPGSGPGAPRARGRSLVLISAWVALICLLAAGLGLAALWQGHARLPPAGNTAAGNTAAANTAGGDPFDLVTPAGPLPRRATIDDFGAH